MSQSVKILGSVLDVNVEWDSLDAPCNLHAWLWACKYLYLYVWGLILNRGVFVWESLTWQEIVNTQR
jgi:hypothetical protein